MFRRRRDEPQEPPWRARLGAARELIESRRPPSWIMDRLASLESALASAHDDRDRLTTALGRLDADRAGAELKSALRQGSSDPAHVALVTSLRERYESIHRVANRRDQLDQAIERALVDAELLAARSVELGAGVDAWELDDTVGRLADDLTALELAHAELADL